MDDFQVRCHAAGPWSWSRLACLSSLAPPHVACAAPTSSLVFFMATA
jgi:hypothetical protein